MSAVRGLPRGRGLNRAERRAAKYGHGGVERDMEESTKPVDEMAAEAAQAPPHTEVAGAPPSLSEVKLVLKPTAGSVGRTDTGETVLEFAAIAEVRVQVLIPEDAKKAIQRGLVGVDIATPADMDREVSAAGGVILKR